METDDRWWLSSPDDRLGARFGSFTCRQRAPGCRYTMQMPVKVLNWASSCRLLSVDHTAEGVSTFRTVSTGFVVVVINCSDAAECLLIICLPVPSGPVFKELRGVCLI